MSSDQSSCTPPGVPPGALPTPCVCGFCAAPLPITSRGYGVGPPILTPAPHQYTPFDLLNGAVRQYTQKIYIFFVWLRLLPKIAWSKTMWAKGYIIVHHGTRRKFVKPDELEKIGTGEAKPL